ncbi:hypothetical protein [Methylomagnum sp.]
MNYKNLIKIVFINCSILYAENSYSMACSVPDAKVLAVMTWSDGHTFLNLDKGNNCGCTIPSRVAFHKNDANAKEFMAQALTAFATKSPVTIYLDSGCTVHTNTAHVYTIVLGGGG